MNHMNLILKQSGLLISSLLPFIIGGTLLGAFLKKRPPARLGKKLVHLPCRISIPVFAVLGALSPICTLGSVPIMGGLIQWGLPFPAALAFIVASSIITPQIAALNFGVLGAGIAISQIAGGFIIALGAGYCCTILAKKDESSFIRLSFKRIYDGSSEKHFFRIILEQLSFILPLLLIGVLLSQALQVKMPGFSLPGVSKRPFFSIALSTLISGPLYFCGGAVLPLLQGLQMRGLSKGAIAAFLICGPATRFQSFTAYSRFLSYKAVLLLTLLIIILSMISGLMAAFFLMPA